MEQIHMQVLLKSQLAAFFNQACAALWLACDWFLITPFIPPKYVCVCVIVCVYAPKAINN